MSDSDEARTEDEAQLVDDEFRALLEGLRTTLPGVQVLFAFLLVVPFQSKFVELTTIQRSAFYVAFATSAIASVLLIAPSVHQRMRAPITGIKRRSRRHLLIANAIAIAGTGALFVAFASAIYLVTSLVLVDSVAALSVAIIAAITVWAWIYVPLVQFERE